MLEEALQFSRKLVEARKRNNHDRKAVDTYEYDLLIATKIGENMECENLLKAIKKIVDEKQNK